MHRFLITNSEQEFTQYENRDCDQSLFVSVAQGQPVLASIDDQRAIRDWPTGDIYYVAVFDPESGQYVNNLSQDQALVAYSQWQRDELA